MKHTVPADIVETDPEVEAETAPVEAVAADKYQSLQEQDLISPWVSCFSKLKTNYN